MCSAFMGLSGVPAYLGVAIMDVSSNIADLTEWMLSVPGPTWAAWFQAVGTLGGIFVAWKIGQEQWRQHLEKESLAERDSVKAVYVLISRSARLIRLAGEDRKSTRLNSSHVKISYAVFCLTTKSH